MKKLIGACALVLLFSGCTQWKRLIGQDDTTPHLQNKIIDGNYEGNIVSSTGTVLSFLKLDLVQSGQDFSGSFRMENNSAVAFSSGSVSGHLSGTDVTLTFSQLFPCAGSYNFDGVHDGVITFSLDGHTGCYDLTNAHGSVSTTTPTRFY